MGGNSNYVFLTESLRQSELLYIRSANTDVFGSC